MKTLIGGDILDITRSKLRYLQMHTPEISPDTSDDITGPVVINDANKRKLRSIITRFINDELHKYWMELSAIEAKFGGDSIIDIADLRKLESKVQVLSNLALTDQDKSRISRFQENIKDGIDFVSDRLDRKPISNLGVHSLGFSVKPSPRLDALKPSPRLDALPALKPIPRLDALKHSPRLDAMKPSPRLDALKHSPRLDAMSSERHKRNNTVRLSPIGNKGGRRRRKRVTVKRRR